MYILFASYGNDSVALIQYAHDVELKDVIVIYSDTGWAADWWEERVTKMEDWVKTLGFQSTRTSSIGLEELVKRKKGWPRQGLQFCTYELKIKPAMDKLDEIDPEKKAICLVGVRREESNNRKAFPSHLDSSPNHGGRAMWAPLVDHTESDRDDLLKRAGIEPLPHRSMECFPCINSNRSDLLVLAENEKRISEIEAIEADLGYTSKGKPRTMFRPYRHMGATGIRQIVKWAQSPRGEFDPDDGTGGCESGFCGL